jgi:hypothetical protein
MTSQRRRTRRRRRRERKRPGANVINLFTAVSYDFPKKVGAFVPGMPFQPSLMFAGKAGSYLSEVHFKCSTLWGRHLSSPTNIRLGWKGLPGTNTLAYY